MSKRAPIKTKIDAIVDYWARRVDESGLSVDWAEADTHCWRCGCEKNLVRCHIIPHALGGKDEPANLVLLCKRCHADGPNVSDPEIMWDWIRAYGVPFYETFWQIQGAKEYEFIYGSRMDVDLSAILDKTTVPLNDQEIKQIVKDSIQDTLKETSKHFGQPYLNTVTMAGRYRMMLKKIAAELEVEFPIVFDDEVRKNNWWASFLGF